VNKLTKRILIIAAACLALCSCKSGEKSTVGRTDAVYCTAKAEVYDISRHEIPQYQWFILDGEGTVIGCGFAEGNAPEITETDTATAIYVPDDEGGEYREFYPATGGSTDWYDCTENGGKRVYLSKETGQFSYPEVLKTYWDESEGVNRDTFVNVEQSPVTDAKSAYERAAMELAPDFDTVDAAFDENNEMWMVTFSNMGQTGGETVYLDAAGKTKLIVSED